MAWRWGSYRRVAFWRTPDGREVRGLKRRPSPDDRFYAATEPAQTFGRDPLDAVRRYRLWVARQDDRRIEFQVDEFRDGYELSINNGPPTRIAGPQPVYASVREDILWRQIETLLKTNPALAAERLGIPQLAVTEPSALAPSTKLRALGEKYRAALHGGEATKAGKHWIEFCRSLGVAAVREVTEPLISAYADGQVAQINDGVAVHIAQARRRRFDNRPESAAHWKGLLQCLFQLLGLAFLRLRGRW